VFKAHYANLNESGCIKSNLYCRRLFFKTSKYDGSICLVGEYSSNYNKINIHIYASVNSNGLTTFSSDCFSISELQKRKLIYEN
jgi:hypothetical protein